MSLNFWSPTGASYFVIRVVGEWQAPGVPTTFALEERRAAGGSLVRAVSLRCCVSSTFPDISSSPDAHALLILPSSGAPARVIVFEEGGFARVVSFE